MTTIYEQIGGEPTIDKLIVAFYQRVLADPLLAPFFEHSSVEKLQTMQKAFFSIALGGPEPDTKIDLVRAHHGRGIESRHLSKFTEHLMATLDEIGVDEQAARRVYDRIATYSNDILGESSVDG